MIRHFYILLVAFLLASCDLYHETESYTTDQYENGALKAVKIRSSKKSRKFEMHDFYQRWDNEYAVYYKNGKKKSESKQYYKRSTYGRPCAEILNTYKEFYEDGTLKLLQNDKCDCRTSITKEFDKKGKVISKKKSHLRRVK